MSDFKIETKPASEARTRSGFDYRAFCETLACLEVNQSFVVHGLSGNHFANAMTWVGYALRRKFTQRKENEGVRVGRIA